MWEETGKDSKAGRPELIASHGHTKITIIYRTIINENYLKTSRKDFSQLKT